MLICDSVRRMKINAGAGLKFPAMVKEVGSYGDRTVDVEFEAAFNPDSKLYEIDRLTVVRGEGSEPIAGTILRRVRVQEAFGEVMRKTTFWLQGDREYRLPYPDRITLKDGELIWEPVPHKKQDQEAWRRTQAERLFVIARAFGQPELRLIQEVLGVSQSTASRLLKQEAATND